MTDSETRNPRPDEVKAAVYEAVPDKYDRVTVERTDGIGSPVVVKLSEDMTAGEACSIQTKLEDAGIEFESELSSKNDCAIWATAVERQSCPDYPKVKTIDNGGTFFAWTIQHEKYGMPELYCVQSDAREHEPADDDWYFSHADGCLLEVLENLNDGEVLVDELNGTHPFVVTEQYLEDDCSLLARAAMIDDRSRYSLKEEYSDSYSSQESGRCFEKEEPDYFDELAGLAAYHDERAEVVRDVHRLAAEVDCDFGGVGRTELVRRTGGNHVLVVRGTVYDIEAEPVQALLNHDRLTDNGRTVEYNVERSDYTFKVKVKLPERDD